MTFADSVLHLVRAGARIDPRGGSDVAGSSEALAAVAIDELADEMARSDTSPSPPQIAGETQNLDIELAVEAAQALDEYEPGLADLEAAVALVEAGIASRVVLAGFPSWPGLLWRAYQLADMTGVLILPTVVRPGGKVDIVISRANAANG